MGKKLPSDILRYMVLKSFEEGPSYGYEVVSCIEEVTEGYWSPSYGTIYPLIQRLEDEGLLKAIDSEEAEERGLENGERKYFELTEEGKDEIPDGGEEHVRENFEELILGYLKIYKNKYGSKALSELIEDLGAE
jgi:DNA-binding PadR family transcriptional regulator